MELDEITITRAIIEDFTSDFLQSIDTDVALVGGGPANLIAARTLARAGVKTVLFERKLEVGGGMWGGWNDDAQDSGPGRGQTHTG